jgi:hypothetical protein
MKRFLTILINSIRNLVMKKRLAKHKKQMKRALKQPFDMASDYDMVQP